MKAVLIGGAGYLGSILCQLNNNLKRYNHLLVIDKDEVALNKIQNVEKLAKDVALLNETDIKKITTDVDDIFILASPIGKDELHDENYLFELNFKIIAKIILAAPHNTCINFFSSGSVFEGYDGIIADENKWPQPLGSYAKYKWLTENFLYRYAKKWRIFRLASCYGRSPNFKAHTLLNQILNTSGYEQPINVRINKSTKVSIISATNACSQILDISYKNKFNNELVHVVGDFLSVEAIISRLSKILPIKVSFSTDVFVEKAGNRLVSTKINIDKNIIQSSIEDEAQFYVESLLNGRLI